MLVEDNPGDAILTREAFKQAKIKNTIHVAKDGEEALQFLTKLPPFEDMPTPDLILLDLNLPKLDGPEVLAEIKKDDLLRRIPVIVLTSSKAETDVVKSYDLHANGYIVKPVSGEKFSQVVSSIENFWFSVVILPQEADS